MLVFICKFYKKNVHNIKTRIQNSCLNRQSSCVLYEMVFVQIALVWSDSCVFVPKGLLCMKWSLYEMVFVWNGLCTTWLSILTGNQLTPSCNPWCILGSFSCQTVLGRVYWLERYYNHWLCSQNHQYHHLHPHLQQKGCPQCLHHQHPGLLLQSVIQTKHI